MKDTKKQICECCAKLDNLMMIVEALICASAAQSNDLVMPVENLSYALEAVKEYGTKYTSKLSELASELINEP